MKKIKSIESSLSCRFQTQEVGLMRTSTIQNVHHAILDILENAASTQHKIYLPIFISKLALLWHAAKSESELDCNIVLNYNQTNRKVKQ